MEDSIYEVWIGGNRYYVVADSFASAESKTLLGAEREPNDTISSISIMKGRLIGFKQAGIQPGDD